MVIHVDEIWRSDRSMDIYVSMFHEGMSKSPHESYFISLFMELLMKLERCSARIKVSTAFSRKFVLYILRAKWPIESKLISQMSLKP